DRGGPGAAAVRGHPGPSAQAGEVRDVRDRRAPPGLHAGLGSEDAAVGVERRLAAEVGEEDVRVLGDVAVPYEVDEAGHGFALVDGVEDDPFEAAGEADGVDGRLHGDAVEVSRPPFQQGDLVVAQVAADADELGGGAGDLLHLGPRLGGLGGGVDAEDAAGAVLAGESGDHPGLGAAGDAAHHDGVEEDAQLAFLPLYLVRPAGEPEPAERVV